MTSATEQLFEDVAERVCRTPYFEVEKLRVEDGILEPVGIEVKGCSDGEYDGFTFPQTGMTYIKKGLNSDRKIYAIFHEAFHNHLFEKGYDDSEQYVEELTKKAMGELGNRLKERGMSRTQFLGAIENSARIGTDGAFAGDLGYLHGRGNQAKTSPETLGDYLVPGIWQIPLGIVKHGAKFPLDFVGNLLSLGRDQPYKVSEEFGKGVGGVSDKLTDFYRKWAAEERKKREEEEAKRKKTD